MEVVIYPNGVIAKIFSEYGYIDGSFPLLCSTSDTGEFHFPSLRNEDSKYW
jgi:hypothetical protein